ncbi:VOC family protein [Serratia fonticola]|jgi:lactoylglutathione lyase|uniref:VOC family protein n=1 Tax=Serratia fonticola TaxID=47917 RepID=A0AAE7JUY5_SERFO|nr:MULTISPECIES: VOC family protein [Serratia]ATM75129.1 glyoxalase/bleomycin resistance/extradiol dioxygenase family protein [Serratia fonticola]MBC3379385.1 VOC family protein [Serratia fonticola]MBL5826400.1 VOC family protein [Serratia fonticola]MBL5903558.1 VOC family protein [Serratia fonticola]NYA38585.1 VOC family protein [Serratia fonticola]
MKIAHVALWTQDIEAQVGFWQRYFNGVAGEEYVSKNRPGFISRFVQLADGPALEIMCVPGLLPGGKGEERVGWAHIALSLGSEALVDELAQRAKQEGILQAAPRWTGDGFYEAIIRDPDGNAIEITA